MYRPDGHGWEAQQEQRGNPDQYADDGYHGGGGGGGGGDNLHVGFQPSSAAFEYMRSLDSQAGDGGAGGRMTPPPRPLHGGGGMGGDYPPQAQRGQSPDNSPTAYGRQGRAPRRPRRTTRATGTGGGGGGGGGPQTSQDDIIPGPLPGASRMVSDMPMSMPSPQPVMSGSGGPIFQDDDHDSSGPHNGSMPMAGGYGGLGARGYDDPMSVGRPPLTSSSPYDNMDGPGGPPAPAGLQQDTSSGSFMPDAPYQNMMNTFSNNTGGNAQDPAVERARNIMASRSGGGGMGSAGDNGTVGSRPMPVAGRPMPPETPSIEPAVPPAQLGRRILTNKPKREPDLVRGRAVQQITSSSKKTHVLCSGCGALLQIPKSAIVVHCRNCNGVYPTASCRLPNLGR